jgi:hypothetical protein
VVKHLRILLSHPTLYIIPSFRIKGFACLVNFYFWVRFKVSGIWPVSNLFFTSRIHVSFVKNSHASIVWSRTPNRYIQTKAPQSITKVVLYLFSKAIEIWWYYEYPCKNE